MLDGRAISPATEIASVAVHGLGVFNRVPSYSIDVVGDVNVTGVYRVNGVDLIARIAALEARIAALGG